MLQNTYKNLGPQFSQVFSPDKIKEAKLMKYNSKLSQDLGLDIFSEEELAQLFSGQKLFPGSKPIAQVYAGHQFGHFSQRLGDGRAVLLGETMNKNGERKDVSLKGSGSTPYSRGGDGKAPLGAAIREYIMCEAMHNLGIPTTRALGVIETGENIIRDTLVSGGIIARVASSHIRIGTFEYFASRGETESIKRLLDYSIERHYPECLDSETPYLEFFDRVIEKQSDLIIHWMRVGFIHGVMNTDNILISGETIDYGPCAFLDAYSQNQVFSSIDQYGRYSFSQQREIIFWNLEKLGICLLPFCSQEALVKKLEEGEKAFEKKYIKSMNAKIGLVNIDNRKLFDSLLEIMQKENVDFTGVFRKLSDLLIGNGDDKKVFLDLFSSQEKINLWLEMWQEEIGKSKLTREEISNSMNLVNPAVIPRNHRVEEAIAHAVDNGDYAYMNKLLTVGESPYECREEFFDYSLAPEKTNNMYQTFCGT